MVGQRRLQDEMRIISILGLGASYIRDFTVDWLQSTDAMHHVLLAGSNAPLERLFDIIARSYIGHFWFYTVRNLNKMVEILQIN